mmetsp:Transcript_11475/g.13165  ORF Transcript_11475/g.13165 Transcript_11475/m.13165 type:complete len:1018 (+) Transcript_11475:130-3183(+)
MVRKGLATLKRKAALWFQGSESDAEGKLKLDKLLGEAVALPEKPGEIEKSILDERSYRALKLDNDLEVLLINDVKAETAAAALSINVGSFSDPEECPGLAHFLEHMLFMGTEKYPDENGYSKFLADNGGYSNAYTADEETNYQFEVMSGQLYHTLDMFAQFFIAPLFKQTSTDRELQAVDNECTGNLQNDYWRNLHVWKSLAKSEHPFSRFNIGNIETLREQPKIDGVNVREYLLEFYEKHYSANLMKLVVLGREDLDTLENWCKELFVPIKNKSLPSRYISPLAVGPAFTVEDLSMRIDYVPVKARRSLSINWLIDPITYENRNTDAIAYISSLIGDEGVGSVLSYLKDKGWANSLSAGPGTSNFDFAFMNVSVGCTEDGIMNHIEDITKVIYAYIGLLKENWKKMQWYYNQEAQLSVIGYRFKSQESPFGYVRGLASSMHDGYPIEKLLTQSLFQGFELEKISEILDQLKPQRCIINVAHESVSEYADKTERWFGTKFFVKPLDETFCSDCLSVSPSDYDGKLSLPPKNDFIPESFSIKDFAVPSLAKNSGGNALLKLATSTTSIISLETFEHAKIEDKRSVALAVTEREITQKWDEDVWRPPVLLESNDTSNLWFKQDQSFKRPIAIINITLKTKILNDSPRTSLLASLYKAIINDTLNEQVYPAMMAGLSYGAGFDENGIYLSFYGYNDKLEDFMKFVNDNLKDPQRCEKSQFDRFKEAIVKNLQNHTKENPYSIANSSLSYSMQDKGWTVLERLEAIETIEFEDVKAFGPRVFDNLSMEMFAYGNITPADAKSYLKTARSSFQINQSLSESSVRKTIVLPNRSQYFMIKPTLDEENPNSAVVVKFQLGQYSRTESVLLSIFSSICHESFFNILRTKEQLGYVVASQKSISNGVLHQLFLVQSNSKDPIYLDQRVEAFIDEFGKTIAEIDEDTFNQGVTSYINSVLSSHKNQYSEAGTWNNDIESELYDFSSPIHLAKIAAELTISDLQAMFQKYFPKDAPCRKKNGFWNRCC